MSDTNNNGTGAPNNGAPTAPQVDYVAELKKTTEALTSQINNLKGELNRKVGNIESRFAPPPQEAEDEPFEELIYSNPKKVIAKLRAEAAGAAQSAGSHGTKTFAVSKQRPQNTVSWRQIQPRQCE